MMEGKGPEIKYRFLLITVFAVFVLLCSQQSFAAVPTLFYLPMPQELVDWVEAHTDHPFRIPPRLGVVDNDADILAHSEGENDAISVAALAAENDGEVYLSVKATVHMQEDKYRALIVHELVHVAQQSNGRSYACAAQREAEAYKLQNLYLVEQNLVPVAGDDYIESLKLCLPTKIVRVNYAAN